MGHDFDLEGVAARTVFSPAERAVMVEQAEAARVQLDLFLKSGREGTTLELLKAFGEFTGHNDYIQNILSHKLGETLRRDHEEGRGH